MDQSRLASLAQKSAVSPSVSKAQGPRQFQTTAAGQPPVVAPKVQPKAPPDPEPKVQPPVQPVIEPQVSVADSATVPQQVQLQAARLTAQLGGHQPKAQKDAEQKAQPTAQRGMDPKMAPAVGQPAPKVEPAANTSSESAKGAGFGSSLAAASVLKDASAASLARLIEADPTALSVVRDSLYRSLDTVPTHTVAAWTRHLQV